MSPAKPATAFILCLLLCLPVTHAQQVCNITCVAEQRSALQSFLGSIGLPTAFNATGDGSTGWSTGPATDPSASPPEHCQWTGVMCCDSSGVVSISSPLNPVPVVYACKVANSVQGLAFPGVGLSGSLPSSLTVWSALSSVIYLRLSGAFNQRGPAKLRMCNRLCLARHNRTSAASCLPRQTTITKPASCLASSNLVLRLQGHTGYSRGTLAIKCRRC